MVEYVSCFHVKLLQRLGISINSNEITGFLPSFMTICSVINIAIYIIVESPMISMSINMGVIKVFLLKSIEKDYFECVYYSEFIIAPDYILTCVFFFAIFF